MEGPRQLHNHEFGELVKFLSTHLREKQTWTIADEYPIAVHTDNLNNVLVIRGPEGLLSAAVMRPMVVKTPIGIFKAAAIGNVVTRPENRNQGLSSQILSHAIAAARARGCDFAILWTNLFDFYRKLGFELAGTEVALHIPENFKAPPAADLKFMDTNRVDPQALLRLYSQHPTGTVRTIDEVRKYLNIPNSRVYTAWDGHNQLQAYAVIGKGADLDGYIHEWGGGVSKVMPLVQFAIEQQKRPLNLITPPQCQNLIRQLEAQGATTHQGVLGMIKILNMGPMLTKIKRYARHMGLQDLILEQRDGRAYFGFRHEIFSTDSETDMVRLLFGPTRASQLHDFDAATAGAFETIFPIPMWIWGWDSV